MNPLAYLNGYPPELIEQARTMLASGELGPRLAVRYPDQHEVRSGKALQAYVKDAKARFMRNAPPLGKVFFDDQLGLTHNALGLHTTRTQVQGNKLRKRREIRIATLFKDAPADFLRMIVVHELAHMKHADHSADFYKLCTYMEPDYHQLEFDLRLYLAVRESDS